jgi:hypothetical protein
LQAVASKTVLIPYDLRPIAEIIRKNPHSDLLFVHNYQGEIGFLSKLERHVDDRHMDEANNWFKQHPEGLAIIRYTDEQEIRDYRMLVSAPYRGKRMGVFRKPDFEPTRGKTPGPRKLSQPSYS